MLGVAVALVLFRVVAAPPNAIKGGGARRCRRAVNGYGTYVLHPGPLKIIFL